MRKEAEEHAEDDKRTRELIDLRNQAEQTIYQTEKALDEHKAKLDEKTVLAISEARQALETATKGDDPAAIRTALDGYTRAAQKLAEILYAQAAPGAEGGGAPPKEGGPTAGPTSQRKDDSDKEDIIDADFEVKS
jgi:molecular chaperone DnaK